MKKINFIKSLKKDKDLIKKLYKKTPKNLKLSDLVVKKPWGYEYLIYSNSDIAAWVLHFKKNAQTSLHAHKYKKTSLVVLEGKILFKNLNNSINLKELDVVLIEKCAFHQSQNISSEEAIILELETPDFKQDLVRYNDKYGRELKGYENKKYYSKELSKYHYISINSPDTYFNPTIRFKSSTITFKYIKGIKDLYEIHFNNSNNDAILFILSGNIKSNIFDLKKTDAVELKIFASNKVDNIRISKKCIVLIVSYNKKYKLD